MSDGQYGFLVTRIGDDEYGIELRGTRYRLHHDKLHLKLEALDLAGSTDAVERLAVYPSDSGVSGSIWSRSGITLDYAFALREGGRVVAASIESGGELREFEAPRDRFPAAIAAALAAVEVPSLHHILIFGGELDTNSDLQNALTPPEQADKFTLSPTCQVLCDAAMHPDVVGDLAGPGIAVVVRAACLACLLQDVGI
ncbi:MAG TPA: hypothetical protein VKG45_15740 [Actinomycetes bacterium]|nr:hypothetical protein [Actinomycetes bacterium]